MNQLTNENLPTIKCSHQKLVDIVELVPHPRNTNKHSQKQINLLARIIEFQGWRHPIIVSNLSGFVVAGHARLEAAKLKGWNEVPVDYQDFANEAEEYAFLESDNRIAELAEHDQDLMKLNLSEMDFKLDGELLGIPDFTFIKKEAIEPEEDDEPSFDEESKKWLIEVQFPNEMEMMDIYDDLINRGYIARVKK